MSNDNELRTIDVFCEKCNVQSSVRVMATHVKVYPRNPIEAQVDPVDSVYDTIEYAIALCARCDSVFLIESNFYEIPGEFCAPQGENVLYPTNRKVSLNSVPTNIVRAYETAARSYQVGLYEPCVIMCRKCIEALCQQFGATRGNLKNKLETLQAKGQIDQKLLMWADELRLIGNDAAHDLNIVIEKIDAQDSLEFIEAILMYVFSLTRKFEEFKNRRASK